ncbi:transglutaminase [Streptomyces sp. NPDC059582]|uniref:transglutaminase n=1 Tax=Streptomyces sp. NPDC059582 TaxID=3346875 RepID=UPI0036B8D4D1
MADLVIDYLHPGPFTTIDPGQFWLLQGMTDDPLAICAAAQALVVLPGEASALGVPGRRSEEQSIRPVRDLMAILAKRLPEPLHHPRSPAARVVGTSRHSATLACALLQSKGYAARARCGFSTRLGQGVLEDQWTTEFWSSGEQRWIRVNPGRPHHGRTAEVLSAQSFLTGGEVWQRFRSGHLDTPAFGADGDDFTRNSARIGASTVRDLAALCQLEMLPGDTWGRMAEARQGRMSVAYDNLIDVVAAVCARGEAADLARLFRAPDLAVPPHLIG